MKWHNTEKWKRTANYIMKTNGNYMTKNTNDTGRCDTGEELIGEMHIFFKKSR